jgi:glycosyltransferase involved in cell wall biosynthesis
MIAIAGRGDAGMRGTMTDTSPPTEQGTVPAARPLLVCLLPARNAEADLPGFLDGVSGYCDAVVALDDGSTDRTAEILDAHPLVRILLRNPRREDYREWDDAENRNRLIEAAEALDPEWLITLDADERLDDRDAASLREFLETDALPGCAYGFRHVPMRGDGDHFLPKYQWVYRLYSAAPGQRFPNQKLHFVPVPTAIPRYRWIRTTLRIQHFGGMTPERRLLRFHKYLEADPRRTYQEDYAHLLDAPAQGELRRWQSRPPGMPVLLASGGDEEDLGAVDDPATPALSAIIISRDDERTIARSVESVVSQEVPEPFEVIVVTSGTDRTASIVRERFPTVTVVELDRPALPGEARNAGLAVARGTYITFPGSHVELLPGSLAARLRAHRRGYAMVTGAVTNGTPTPAGWASYFLDQSETLPGHPPAEFEGPPGHCSYARLPLLEVGDFPEGVRTAEDTAVNRALVKRGYVAYRDPEVRFIHRSRCTTVPRLLRHHFRRGRGWGRMLVARHRERGMMLDRPFLQARLLDAVPTRLERIDRSVRFARADIVAEYERVRPLVAAGAVASWLGMWYELLRPAPGKLDILLGHPVLNLLIARGDELSLAQIDHVTGQATLRAVSPALPVPRGERMVPLAEVIGGDGGAPRSLAESRAAAGEALNVADLECIVPANGALPGDDAGAPAGGLAGAVSFALAVARGLRSGAIRSTLPAWSTIRALRRIQTLRGS